MNITKQTMKDAVETVANQLMVRDGNITTLFLKNELRVQYPNVRWYQYTTGQTPGVSDLFHELVGEGKFKSIANNGTYQTYVPTGRTSGKKVQQLGNAIQKASAKQAKKTVSTTGTVTARRAISRKKALELMQNNRGHFFTVEFVKQDGSERKLNGQYVKDQKNSQLGYVLVKEASKLKTGDKEPIRNVNLQTLKTLKIGGTLYKVR